MAPKNRNVGIGSCTSVVVVVVVVVVAGGGGGGGGVMSWYSITIEG